METYVTTFLIIGITVLAVLTVSVFAWGLLQPNPHPEVVPVSNVIAYKDEKVGITKTYYINFRVACKNAPAKVTSYTLNFVYPFGRNAKYELRAYGSGMGTYYDSRRRMIISVYLYPASNQVCDSNSLNKGRDMVITVRIMSAWGYWNQYVAWINLESIVMQGELASGGKWRAIITLPDKILNIGD